ncbi:hypothetical protein [Kitasatospora sp. NPDC094015]|uniref:hypothetical protein n=1 Tax=Kitasatospora sp. NPDC094015 TaxID=3155205 RepID=UPI003329AFA7
MTRTTGRLPAVAAGAALAAAAGLFAAPPAGAAGTAPVRDPRTAPVPGFATTGQRTACGADGAPGWITTAAPTLTVTADSPEVRFTVRDDQTPAHTKVFDATASTTAGTAQVTTAGLTDGHAYSWRAKGVHADDPTDACRFRVDSTAPAQLTVESTDFPSQGTPSKHAGQIGSFTLGATDPASGVACYWYTTGPYLSFGQDCTDPAAVAAGPDGRATVPIRVTSWGTNTLTVRAMDKAGNISWPAQYTFYAPSDPNPPSTPGDVDGDGVPDILLPDAKGNLQIISAAATTAAPTSVVAANRAPDHAGWGDYQLVHRGWGEHAPMDDLIAFRPRTGPYLYRNTDYGTFTGGVGFIDRPADLPWDEPTIPADFATDWGRTDQLVSVGELAPHHGPSLLTVEDGDLWLLTAVNSYSFWTVGKLSTAAWAGYDLIAPGTAADGTFALWSRERATGVLRSYPVTRGTDGSWDFSALADPAAGTVTGNFPVAQYPTLGSSGDGNGDGHPDLYAVTAQRHLLTFDGVATPKDLGVLA